MKIYLYGAIFFVFIGFIYWYSSNQSEAGYNECKTELADVKARIEYSVANVRAEEEKRLAIFRKSADKEKRKLENELAKYKNNPEVKKWSSSAVPDVIADNVWLYNNSK